MDVLSFLEQRGASPDVLRLAMMRAGIAPEVSQLLSQCFTAGQAKMSPPERAADRLDNPRLGTTATLALRWLIRTFLVWCGLLLGGLGIGIAIGLDIGIAQGFEEGIDRFAAALRSSRWH